MSPFDLRTLVASLGGAAKTVELLQAGATKRRLAAAVRSGELLRPRKAWYVLPQASPTTLKAVRVGGRATCVSALSELGVWVTDPIPRVHVAVHRAACQLRAARDRDRRQTVVGDAVVHWVDTPRPRDARGSRLLEAPDRALADAIVCLEGEALLATVESVLHRELIDFDTWQTMLARMPSAVRSQLARASDRSESGIETYFVTRMRLPGIRVAQQVWIGRDRVDVLLGDCLVVELDGLAFHESHRDYVRDARLVLNGCYVLHFSSHQVLRDWPSVEAVVLAAIARGDHLR
jgi:very-short-patch-repair endonuclease